MALKSLLPQIVATLNRINSCRIYAAAPALFCKCKFSNSVKPIMVQVNRSITTYKTDYIKQKTYTDTDFNESKSKLISMMNFESTQDALPFCKLPIKTLLLIYKTTKNDENNGYCKNRLYYISRRIKCSPTVLSECLAKRSFVYKLSFDWLERSLDVLLEMNVSGDRILRDLWVLKYHHETIRERLQNVKDMGVDVLYPWMVRCSEDILNRFITISQDTKNILGDNKSTHIYLANRLNTSPKAIEEMSYKIPALKTIRVTKVKHFLDFLINEGFDEQDIANKPRVLTASQKTVEQRLHKLRKLGLSEINLNVLCRSRKGFKKFCESYESVTGQSKITDAKII